MKLRTCGLAAIAALVVACFFDSASAQAQFAQQGPKLVGTGAIGPAEQGSVSLSADGNTAIVGGPADNSNLGAAWVFTRAGGIWSQQAKLVGTDAIGDAQQGFSVSLSTDGNTAIIGGPADNSNLVDNNNLGAAWVFTRAGGVWSQQAKLVGASAIGVAAQGFSVSLSADGNTAIIGGPADNSGLGAAWVFTRAGGVWSQQTKLVGTGAIGIAEQGYSISLSADGNTAIVGGLADNSNLGAAWVFTRAGGVWSQQAKLVGASAIGVAEQGYSVSLSDDGSTAIVGGVSDNAAAGAVWVFTRAGGVWSQQAKLVGASAIGVAEQGYSVSLSDDGSTAIVGGVSDNAAAGAVWVFTRAGGVWSQQAKLVGTDAIGDAQQGYSVSLSDDGSTAIVGGPFDNNNVGAAWVFVQPVFAGTPGKANCRGQSVSALVKQYGGLPAAAAARDYSSVQALQNAIAEYYAGAG